jgi:hypothetical protein
MSAQLKQMIEGHLRRTKSTPTRFGRDACGDPRLVADLRNGREVGRQLTARIINFLEVKQ